MPASSDRELALSAVDNAYQAGVQQLVQVLQQGLTGQASSPADAIARFEAGLSLMKRTRETAVSSIVKVLV